MTACEATAADECNVLKIKSEILEKKLINFE